MRARRCAVCGKKTTFIFCSRKCVTEAAEIMGKIAKEQGGKKENENK
jgi:hypothetical protein